MKTVHVKWDLKLVVNRGAAKGHTVSLKEMYAARASSAISMTMQNTKAVVTECP